MCVHVSSTLALASTPDVVLKKVVLLLVLLAVVLVVLLLLAAVLLLLLMLLLCTDARRRRSGEPSLADEAALAWKRCSREIRRWLSTEEAGLSATADDDPTLSVEPLSEELGEDNEDEDEDDDDLSESGEARCCLPDWSLNSWELMFFSMSRLSRRELLLVGGWGGFSSEMVWFTLKIFSEKQGSVFRLTSGR